MTILFYLHPYNENWPSPEALTKPQEPTMPTYAQQKQTKLRKKKRKIKDQRHRDEEDLLLLGEFDA